MFHNNAHEKGLGLTRDMKQDFLTVFDNPLSKYLIVTKGFLECIGYTSSYLA